MATLPVGTINDLRQRLCEDISSRRAVLALNRADLQAALVATDQWIDDNALNFNQALPVAARTGLTAKQKAELLATVMRRRFEAI